MKEYNPKKSITLEFIIPLFFFFFETVNAVN